MRITQGSNLQIGFDYKTVRPIIFGGSFCFNNFLVIKVFLIYFHQNMIANIVSVSNKLKNDYLSLKSPTSWLPVCCKVLPLNCLHIYERDLGRQYFCQAGILPGILSIFHVEKRKIPRGKYKHLTVLLGIRLKIRFHTDSCLCPTGLPVESC